MNDKIDPLFNLLDEWRCLPKYQLERRADIFFALYMKEIIEHAFPGARIDRADIIPEFPLRKGTMSEGAPDDDRSTNVDYLVLDRTASTAYLVELKTDESSVGSSQRTLLVEATRKIPALLDGILRITAKPKLGHRWKYEALRRKLHDLKWVEERSGEWIRCGAPKTVKAVYIKPTGEWSQRSGGPDTSDITVISFKEVWKALDGISDGVSERFRKSLKEWA